MKLQRTAVQTAILATTLASGVAMAQDPSPYMKPDDTWITISGTVEDVTRDAFKLDYGSGMVMVEMDDGDRDADAYKLFEGDEVTVHGIIDADFFETTSIEASSVYLPKLATHFYASPVDEEDYASWYNYNWSNVELDSGEVIAQGTVTSVDDEKFTISRDSTSLTISTQFMDQNPLDDVGYHQVDVGDIVQISGDLEFGFMNEAELEADEVITLVHS